MSQVIQNILKKSAVAILVSISLVGCAEDDSVDVPNEVDGEVIGELNETTLYPKRNPIQDAVKLNGSELSIIDEIEVHDSAKAFIAELSRGDIWLGYSDGEDECYGLVQVYDADSDVGIQSTSGFSISKFDNIWDYNGFCFEHIYENGWPAFYYFLEGNNLSFMLEGDSLYADYTDLNNDGIRELVFLDSEKRSPRIYTCKNGDIYCYDVADLIFVKAHPDWDTWVFENATADKRFPCSFVNREGFQKVCEVYMNGDGSLMLTTPTDIEYSNVTGNEISAEENGAVGERNDTGTIFQLNKEFETEQ